MKVVLKWSLGILIVGGLIGVGWWYNSIPGELDGFARCLEQKGAVFYGAFWCPHCQEQKDVFGRSAKYLPYVECSTADGRSQLERCREKEISGYPTWEFEDGERIEGTMSLLALAEKTKCELNKS